MKQKLVKIIVLIISIIVVTYAMLNMGHRRDEIVYSEHLDDTVVTIDDDIVTFEDLAFYILYEERKVEEQAKIYNPDSTKDYWNLHTNDTFIQNEAKRTVIGMAIHDQLFYKLAVEDGMDTLTEEEESDLQFAITDFWEDLLDEQWEKLPCSQDTINEQIRKAAVAEKFQKYLAENKGPSEAAYKYDGYYYESIKDEHSIKINDKLWDRFVLGDVTLTHTHVNFINGINNRNNEED